MRYYQNQLDMMRLLERYECLTRRELLKLTRQAWRRLGHDRSRGWTMRPWHAMRRELELLVVEARKIALLFKSSRPPSEQQLLEHIHRLYNLCR